MTKESSDEKIHEAFKSLQVEELGFDTFNKHTKISARTIRKYYDNWSEACKANGLKSGTVQDTVSMETLANSLRSSDFKAHKHPVNGCDLIICWEHDWKDCPLEVLELKKAIQPLSGWREN